MSKSLKLIKRDQKEIKNRSKKMKKIQYILTFLIKFDFLYLLINFKVIFFNLLIKNWLNSNEKDQNEIQIKINNTILTIKS